MIRKFFAHTLRTTSWASGAARSHQQRRFVSLRFPLPRSTSLHPSSKTAGTANSNIQTTLLATFRAKKSSLFQNWKHAMIAHQDHPPRQLLMSKVQRIARTQHLKSNYRLNQKSRTMPKMKKVLIKGKHKVKLQPYLSTILTRIFLEIMQIFRMKLRKIIAKVS